MRKINSTRYARRQRMGRKVGDWQLWSSVLSGEVLAALLLPVMLLSHACSPGGEPQDGGEKTAPSSQGDIPKASAPEAPEAATSSAEGAAHSVEPEAEPPQGPAPLSFEPVARWEDAVGNTTKQEGVVFPDIVAVEASSGEGQLVIRVDTAEGNLQSLFTQKLEDGSYSGNMVADLFLDFDGDEATGVQADRAEGGKGFDLKLSLVTGYRFTIIESGERSAMYGTIAFSPEQFRDFQPDASILLWPMTDACQELGFWSRPDIGEQDELARQSTVAKPTGISITIPYDWFDLKPGMKLRLAYSDDWTREEEFQGTRGLVLQ